MYYYISKVKEEAEKVDKFEKECKLEVSMKEKQVCSVLQSSMYSSIFETNLEVSLIFELFCFCDLLIYQMKIITFQVLGCV